jgi:mono/diheme cytochrome c family protein
MRALIFCTLALPAVAQTTLTFEKDVLPVFTQHCFTCHGQSSPQLGLDLRTAATTLRGSHNGPVIVKGDPEKSLLYRKISTKAMPPPAFKLTMPESQIEIVKRWIAEGAVSDKQSVTSKEVLEQRASFDKDLMPLFAARCVQCHGDGKPMGGLDLRSLSALLKGSVNGAVVVEGFSDRSILVRKLASRSMPPPGAGQPLTEQQIEAIRKWIDKGHLVDHTESHEPEEREFTKAEAPDISAKDREFWSFRKPVAAPVPRVKALKRVRTPIDAFVLSKLESKKLTLSADASPRTLLRRAYVDLLGIPPTPEEVAAFLNDTKPGAYERLLDRLLASPQYGERWGRHWLDAAGYVDTQAKDFEANRPDIAEGMWRYRDYVIKSTNEDKPWNRFLTEQVAGDEIVDWRNATKYTPETVELLTATGYLRNVLDITDDDITNLPVERYEALFKLMEKVSSSTMGLTMACARCHTHKFDPIPQRDYYRMLALFTNALNPTSWIPPKNRTQPTVSKPEQEEIERHNKEVDHALAGLKQQLAKIRGPYEQQLLEDKLKALPEAIREDVRVALATAEDKRDEVQKFLARKFAKQLAIEDGEVHKVLKAADAPAVDRLESQIKTWTGYRKKLDVVQAVWDVGEPPSIRLLQRGSAEAPGPKVQPGFLTVTTAPDKLNATRPAETQGKTSGMRLAFGNWLSSRDNPLTARVIVNRIWQHHFGKGIVETPDNFGRMGAPPSNQELLDWLAVDFMENGWKAKRLHKMIMMSSVYQQSSQQQGGQVEAARNIDPENKLLWRMNLKRLEAEALRDSILAAAGKLDLTMGGPPVLLHMRTDGLETVSPKESPSNQNRRSVYLLARRTYPLTMLGLFDFPIIDTNCTRRVPSSTPLQALTLMNDEFVVKSAEQMAQRAAKLAGESAPADRKIEALYSIALLRKPTGAEILTCKEHLEKQNDLFTRANLKPSEADQKAFDTLSQALMSSNEFLYVD